MENKDNLKEEDKLLFIMNIELEKDKIEELKIYTDSNPGDVAYQFHMF